MGVVRQVLASGEYNESALPYAGRLVIEDNVGETVHVHLGHLRIEFTPEQFLWIADVFTRAAKRYRNTNP